MLSNSQSGYISIAIIIFMLLLSIFLYPKLMPVSDAGPCTVGEPPGNPAEVLKDLPAIKNMMDDPRLGQVSDPTLGGPDPSEKSDFVLIRRRVPTSQKSTPGNWVFLGGTSIGSEAHTVNVGVLPQKPGFDAYYPAEWGEMDLPGRGRKYIRGEGLLIFTNNSPGTIRQKDDNTIYLSDIYQDVRIYNDKNKGYKEGDLFICGVDTEVEGQQVVIPTQNESKTEKQLQLEWLLFAQNKVWGVHCKPAIYLYPKQKTLVNVKVLTKGEFIYTDPLYNPKTGWNVTAYPDGKLEYQSLDFRTKNYDYLYYESRIPDSLIDKPERGWVIKTSEIPTFFEELLPDLGLNTVQKKDFIDYWQKTLTDSPYLFVGVINQQNINSFEPLEITPKPDSINRVRIYFERLNEPKSVQSPVLSSNPALANSQFSVTEWGGMVKNDLNHPFTCSQ